MGCIVKKVELINQPETDVIEIDTSECPAYVQEVADLTLNTTFNPKGPLPVRCFFLLGGKVAFGISMGETPDSFLVALAVNLVQANGEIDGRPMSTARILRIPKSGVGYMCLPTEEHRYYYYRYLAKVADIAPDILNEITLGEVFDFVDNYEKLYNTKSSSEVSSQFQLTDATKVAPSANPNSFYYPNASKERH